MVDTRVPRRHLLGATGSAAISQLMRQRVLLAFDFDGTLAPIVATPDLAHVPVEMAAHLSALAAQCPVAVVTGRSMADVCPRLGFEPAFVVGNHGAEGLGWSVQGRSLQTMREKAELLAPALVAAGVQFEDKGLSLALHYRQARNPGAALGAIESYLADLPDDLASYAGKCVMNVVLRDAPDKGDAVVELLKRSGCDTVFFVGDDSNDEPVFELAPATWLTARIGESTDITTAMFYLSRQAQMLPLLAHLRRALTSAASSFKVAAETGIGGAF
jgi:trehalose 6-phosphate phosphatase